MKTQQHLKTAAAMIAGLFFCTGSVESILAVQQGSLISTKMGELRVVTNQETMKADTLTLNGLTLLRKADDDVSIEKLYSFADRIVIMISIKSEGASAQPAYALVVIRSDAKPVIIENKDLYSGTHGDIQVTRSGEILTIDLGFSEGFKKTARLEGDTLTVSKEKDNKTRALAKADCDWLYSQVLEECSGMLSDNCSDPLEAVSVASLRGLSSLNDSPAFSREIFTKICAEACTKKQKPDHVRFMQTFCGIQ
jgi:hypothetical protein